MFLKCRAQAPKLRYRSVVNIVELENGIYFLPLRAIGGTRRAAFGIAQ